MLCLYRAGIGQKPIGSILSGFASSSDFSGRIISDSDKDDTADRIISVNSGLRRFFDQNSGIGCELQRRVETSAEIDKADVYIPYRSLSPNYDIVPRIISSGWWAKFEDVGLSDMLLRRPPPENVYSYDQLTRATEFIWNMLSFKRIVDEGRLYVEEDGVNEETLLRRYSRMFCEVKQMSSDADKNRNILVVANDKLFLLQVIKSDGKPATFKAINNGLYRICDLSLHSDPGLPIPLLSTASPTIWNRSFKELKEISERNSANLESIDRAIFAVCLDSYSSHKRDDISIHQFSMNFDCGNRWFDKPLSIIVNNSARSGLCANLQYTDIQAASRVINYIIANEPAKRTDPSNDRVEVVEPKALEWDTNDKIVKLLDDAKDGIREYVYPIEACVLETKYYGRKFINEISKADPDAMIMIAICLAWYRALSKVPHSALIYNLQCNGDSFPSLVRIPPGLVEKFIEAFDNDDTLYASKLTIFNETVDNIKKLKTERRDSVDILVHADSLVNAATPGPEMEQVYKSIKEITHDKIEKVDILATNFDKSHLFISGIQTRHPKPCTISYHITDFTVSFSFSTSKAYSKALCFELRREVDRAIKELMILFPLRSEAWGPHWVFGKNMIDREVGILRVHRLLTDKYMEKVNLVKERFEKFRRPAEDDKEL